MQIRRWPTCSLHVLFRFFSTPMRCFRKKDFAQEVSKPIWGFQAFPKRLIEKCHSLWKMWTNVDISDNHMKRAAFHSKKNLVDGTNGANVKTNWVVHANIGPVIFTYVYKCHYMRIDQYPPKYVWVWKYDKICTIIPFSSYEQDGIPPASSPRCLAHCVWAAPTFDVRCLGDDALWLQGTPWEKMKVSIRFTTILVSVEYEYVHVWSCLHQINIIDCFNNVLIVYYVFYFKKKHKWLVWVDVQSWHIWPVRVCQSKGPGHGEKARGGTGQSWTRLLDEPKSRNDKSTAWIIYI